MDASRFDAWTRRRFGIALGGAVASSLGFAASRDADARKKRKKRCKRIRDSCAVGGNRRCCSGLACQPIDGLQGTRCCRPPGASCTGDPECCGTYFCGAGACVVFESDRKLKANFGSVDPADMLQRLRDLPISTWNYTIDDASIRHIGPMAQDFRAAFSVGADDRHIHPLDGQGVALAAIQGLFAEVDGLREESRRLCERLNVLEQVRSEAVNAGA